MVTRQKQGYYLYLNYYALALLLAFLLFASGLNNYFCSDDWPALLRNIEFIPREIPAWFTEPRAGWYRPVHDVFMALCWQLFGLTVWPYRLMSLIVYAWVAANMGILGYLLTDDARVGKVTLLLFSVLAPHAEPVLWFAATNELLTALFISTAAITYLIFRKTGHWLWFGVACVGCGLALLSKETSLLLPLVLPGYDLLNLLGHKLRGDSARDFAARASCSSPGLLLIPGLSIGGLWLAFLLFRLPMGSAYTSAVSYALPRLLMNGVYYVLIGIFALPNNYAFLTSASVWRAFPVLPLLAMGSSGLIVVMFLWLWMKTKIWQVWAYTRTLLFAVLWSGLGLAPVIFIVAERSIFLSSMGIALALAMGLVGAWRGVRRGEHFQHTLWRGLTTLMILLSIGMNTCVLLYRSAWFDHSSSVSRAVFTQLDDHLTRIPPGEHIVLINLPDHIAHTFTFRNTFPAATQVVGYEYDITVILDTAWTDFTPQAQVAHIQQCQEVASCSVLWYDTLSLTLLK
ncbi:MAG: glycosyltransferase family 39 protein [Anaerolineae bacterium]|nr:glycosyltransferase family 39 protein [Anaerolineae bacterium]